MKHICAKFLKHSFCSFYMKVQIATAFWRFKLIEADWTVAQQNHSLKHAKSLPSPLKLSKWVFTRMERANFTQMEKDVFFCVRFNRSCSVLEFANRQKKLFSNFGLKIVLGAFQTFLENSQQKLSLIFRESVSGDELFWTIVWTLSVEWFGIFICFHLNQTHFILWIGFCWLCAHFERWFQMVGY